MYFRNTLQECGVNSIWWLSCKYHREMRSEWKRAPKGWSKGKLVECAYVAITLAALNVHFAARGNGRTDSPVQIWHRRRVKEEGRGGRERVHKRGCKYRADEFLHPLPVMHDAMLLTLYMPTETTLFPRFLLRHLRLRRSTAPFPRTSPISPRLALGYLFLFISTIESPHLYPSASSRPVIRPADLAVYFIIAQNDFASSPSKLLDYVVNGDWIIIDRIER